MFVYYINKPASCLFIIFNFSCKEKRFCFFGGASVPSLIFLLALILCMHAVVLCWGMRSGVTPRVWISHTLLSVWLYLKYSVIFTSYYRHISLNKYKYMNFGLRNLWIWVGFCRATLVITVAWNCSSPRPVSWLMYFLPWALTPRLIRAELVNLLW